MEVGWPHVLSFEVQPQGRRDGETQLSRRAYLPRKQEYFKIGATGMIGRGAVKPERSSGRVASVKEAWPVNGA
jgi:hypothetical protein